ncbi:MAG: penicillin-binding protein 2 [Anaerolineae bacterium]|nr:penicillin-binding protein 2 [Anaerolineae bacterium]
MTEFQIRLRSNLFRAVVLLVFVVLATQLWNLQVVQGERYSKLADANRFRLIQVPASRGVMYDRTGELLVRNRPVYNVVIIPAYLPEDATAEAKIFARLSELLDLPITTQVEPTLGYNNGYFQAITHHQYNRQLRRQIVNPRSRQFARKPLGLRDAANQNRVYAPFLSVTVATDVDPITVSKIEEARLNMPGVFIEVEPSREFLYGSLTSHLLGYTGSIPAEQFDQYDAKGYHLTDEIGLAGLEGEYEDWLRGIKGLESIEVDVTGRKVRTVSQNIQARPGHNLRLTIDLGLQKAVTEALQEQMDEVGSKQGVAIALNPQTGEILAMVSLPAYDNNFFSRGITLRELSLLSEDPNNPLVNHAIAGLYPPGSTFKIIPAAGALQERTVYPDTTFFDEGILYLPNRFEPDNPDLAQPFYCWLRTGHGEVNMISGLAYSCDVYFYQVGGGYEPIEYEGLGLERMVRYAEMFGLGAPTGVDLPGELSGLVPNKRWKRLNYAETWLTGDTYNMTIGQGFVLVTPLQILNATAAIANGGTLYRPHLVKEILDAEDNVVEVYEPEVIRQLEVEPQFINLIQQGLRAVVEWPQGTAHEDFDVPGVIASGKTGTAEFCDEYPQCLDSDGRVKTSHAWFTAYAPSYNPEIATVVFIYGGGEGSTVAIPVTNKILRYYFDIPDEEEIEETEETEEVESVEAEESGATPLPAGIFTARLLGTDSWREDGASVSGYVLDEDGRGIPNITIDILANGDVVAQVVSGSTGQFDYNGLSPSVAANWQLHLPDYPESQLLQLEVAEGLRYLVEFKSQSAGSADAAIP